jgi:methylenetetrahydrofolate dehydrogenase (NADP+)/methenyltetrahydrofolate cyclohydrolase
MAAQILNGNQAAAEIAAQVATDVAALTAAGRPPRLTAIHVGDVDAALLYAKSQRRRCESAGIAYELQHLPADTSASELGALIERLNGDPRVTGIVLLTPLPAHLNEVEMQYAIDPYKDVEGVNPANIGLAYYGRPIIAPCSALAVMEMLRIANRPLEGAHAVVVGQSAVVGRPITIFLLQQHATVVGCHKYTRDLPAQTKAADVLVVAVGRAKLLTADMVKPGAVVIDVGINTVSAPDASGALRERIVGDVDFDTVSQVAGAITPVPGGVGPLTVAILMRNTVEAVRKQSRRGHL